VDRGSYRGRGLLGENGGRGHREGVQRGFTRLTGEGRNFPLEGSDNSQWRAKSLSRRAKHHKWETTNCLEKRRAGRLGKGDDCASFGTRRQRSMYGRDGGPTGRAKAKIRAKKNRRELQYLWMAYLDYQRTSIF